MPREALIKSFDRLGMNGNILIPFVVSLSNHERKRFVQRFPSYITSLFIFRRDLRLHDNTGLNEALRLSEKVIPCFIFDPRQIEPHAYQSKPGLRFMRQSIDDLERQLKATGGKLALYHAVPQKGITQLFVQQQIEAVFICRYGCYGPSHWLFNRNNH